jgi:hypothetical protein
LVTTEVANSEICAAESYCQGLTGSEPPGDAMGNVMGENTEN